MYRKLKGDTVSRWKMGFAEIGEQAALGDTTFPATRFAPFSFRSPRAKTRRLAGSWSLRHEVIIFEQTLGNA